MRRAALLALAATLALSLAACGRKTQPHSPEHAFYPQKYPAVALPDQPATAPEPVGELEYRQLQERQRVEQQKGVLIPAPASPPAQPGFQDLDHPAADTPSGKPSP